MTLSKLDTVYCLWYNKETKKFETLKQVMKSEEDKEKLIKPNTTIPSISYDNGWYFNKDEVDRKVNELNKKLVDSFDDVDPNINYLKVLWCEDCGKYWIYSSFIYQLRVKNGNGFYPRTCPKCTYKSRERVHNYIKELNEKGETL